MAKHRPWAGPAETTVTGCDCAPDRMLELSQAGPEQVLDQLVKRLEWLCNE
jgi:hypothetical protein